MADFHIGTFINGEELAVQYLVQEVFDEFIAPVYTPAGNAFFHEFIVAPKIIERIASGHLLLTAKSGGIIIGIIEIRDGNHICLLFVRKQWHRKGVARALVHEGLTMVHGVKRMEVNASPFSEAIYSRLGFVRTGDMQELNGMKFVPMKLALELPGNPL